MAESQRRPLEINTVYHLRHQQNVKVLEYKNKSEVLVEFQDARKFTTWCEKSQIVKGTLKNPYESTLFDRGFIGEGRFRIKSGDKNTVEYVAWSGMFWRCYDERKLIKNPTYAGCYVQENWYNFQDFCSWFACQKQAYAGWCLDKDLLVRDNKCYSADTCCLLPAGINTLLAYKRKENGCPPGVHYGTKEGLYKAQIKDRFSGRNQRLLGMSNDPVEMFFLYKEAKESEVKFLAGKWKGDLDKIAYEQLMIWTVDIDERRSAYEK